MECIKGDHDFVDVYDSVEDIPDEVVEVANNFSSSESVVDVLNAGKLVDHTYILSYCKKCGLKVERSK